MKFISPKRWTEKSAVRMSDRLLERADQAVMNVAYIWGDEDEYVVTKCDELRDNIAKLQKEMKELVAERAERDRFEQLEREAQSAMDKVKP